MHFRWGCAFPVRMLFLCDPSSPGMQILNRKEDVPHSLGMRMYLNGNAAPHRKWGYDSRGIHIIYMGWFYEFCTGGHCTGYCSFRLCYLGSSNISLITGWTAYTEKYKAGGPDVQTNRRNCIDGPSSIIQLIRLQDLLVQTLSQAIS